MATGGGVVSAGDWDISAAVGLVETYTDNANLASDNGDRNSDLISEIAPSLRIRGSGGRASLNLDFSHRQLFFKNTGQDDSFQDLEATGQVEIWDRVAFIDSTASMSRQVINPRDATDPPPLKWSTLMYVTGIEEDRYAKEALQAGRDRHEAAPGGCFGVAG